MFSRPQFQRATCKGSYMLGTACGNCERCEWERKNSAVAGVSEQAAYGTIFEFPDHHATKQINCGKCDREMLVSQKTVFAICGDCTKDMGRKK